MTPQLRHTLCDHAAGNYRILTTMAAELLHLRQILALAEMHGREAVARAIDDGLELAAFSAEYIAHILAARRRIGAEPAALQLTRARELLELEIPEPDLSIYDRD